MQLSVLIKVWGLIDIGYIVWVVYRDIARDAMPFYDSFVEIVEASESFGLLGATLLSYVSYFMSLTILASGILMLFLSKIGVYISYFQLPFRVFLLMPPTFFFLANLNYQSMVPVWLVITALIILDLLKTYSQVKWIKQ